MSDKLAKRTPVGNLSNTSKEEVDVDLLDFNKNAILYRSQGGYLCQFMRLAKNLWGFVYLDRPDICPVFTHHNPRETLRRALKRHDLYTCSTFDLNYAITNHD